MKSYAILSYPGHNRVYFEVSKKFSINEMNIVGRGLSVEISNTQLREIAGIPYITFDSSAKLTVIDLQVLRRLSFFYALYEISGTFLIPTDVPESTYMDSSISSMLKYTGKTNEIFTRMLINIAVYSSNFFDKPDLKILDPVAGKGTTLFEGLIFGYNVYGVEIGSKIANEVYHFFKKYLEGEKYKHNADKIRISGPNKSFTAQRYTFRYSKTKEEFNNKSVKEFEIIAGNSVNASTFFKKEEMDIIVGDLPYGVQHASVTKEHQSLSTRNPKELLAACLPAWKAVLKKDGVVVLSWNAFVLKRPDIIDILKEVGFYVFEGDNYDHFEHRVDQAIKRDIVVAKKI